MVTSMTPDQIAAKWAQRVGASTQQMTDGVNAVDTAPGQKAAAAADLWLQRVTAARDKYRTNVGRVTLQEWKNAMINVGIPRVAQGAQANVGKVSAFMAQFMPYLAQGVARVQAMPKGDINASIARAAAMIQHNAAFKRS